jgi:hypothetical protein
LGFSNVSSPWASACKGIAAGARASATVAQMDAICLKKFMIVSQTYVMCPPAIAPGGLEGE